MDNNDEELHRETKEEEEIKLQESDVDLFARDHVSVDARWGLIATKKASPLT